MTALTAVIYSFLFGLLHGVLPDEHTWPITFSYAIGGATGLEGIKAGLYFSAAFTLQRTLLSEAAYLALAPFLLQPDCLYCCGGRDGRRWCAGAVAEPISPFPSSRASP